MDIYEGLKREMDVLYFEYGKKYRFVFSEVFYFGLDVGIVYG